MGKTCKIITVTNQKGGVAKSSTVQALAGGLIKREFKTLVIDSDPQSNLSFAYGIEDADITLYELFNSKAEPKEAIVNTDQGDIIPGSLMLAGADMEYTKPGREYILKEIVESVKNEYDFIIIDTPPALGILTINALTASNSLIIPMGADVFSLQGLSQLKGTVDNVRKYCNRDLFVSGLLLTKYNPRTILSRDVKKSIEDAAKRIGTKVFNATIRDSVSVREAQATQTSLFMYCPKALVTQDYNDFIEEFLKGELKR